MCLDNKVEDLVVGLVSGSDRASGGVYVDQGSPALREWLDAALVAPVPTGADYQVRRCSGMASPPASSGVSSQRAVHTRRAKRQPSGVRATTSS